MLFKPLRYLLVTATQHGKNASRRIPGTLTHWIALHALPEPMGQNIQHEHCMDGGSIGSGTTQIQALAVAGRYLAYSTQWRRQCVQRRAERGCRLACRPALSCGSLLCFKSF